MVDRVYKVVTAVLQDGEEIYWGSLHDLSIPWTVQYKRYEQTYPTLQGSFLYAFDDREAALAYVTGSAEILKPTLQPQVWEANAHIVATKPIATIESIEDFWGYGYHAIDWPCDWMGNLRTQPHTVWCEWIELTKMIRGEHPQPPEKRKKGWPAGVIGR